MIDEIISYMIEFNLQTPLLAHSLGGWKSQPSNNEADLSDDQHPSWSDLRTPLSHHLHINILIAQEMPSVWEALCQELGTVVRHVS